MLFNSAIFLLFFIMVYCLYWKVLKTKRLWLLVISGCVFYGTWDWRFLLLLFFTSGIDFLAAKEISTQTERIQAKKWLMLSVSLNLITLGFFKYFNFFVASFQSLLQHFGFHANPSTLIIILPVGISFYTFQSIAYVTDVYRGKTVAVKSPLQYFAFICFFPQMVAGPIERANRMLPQFTNDKKWNPLYFESGINLLTYGFFKKVVIADNLALITDHIHQNISTQSSFTLFCGVFVFAIQIYTDFSGYTDIARGTARLLGYKLSRNFYFPYFASSFRGFWKRWHISLSTWFRDYLYIPIGGKFVSPLKRNFNLILTFVVSGLWHGANFTFLAWGFFHGMALVIEKSFKKVRLPHCLGGIIVFMVVSYLFTLFRSPNLGHFLQYTANMFAFKNNQSQSLFLLTESGYYFSIPLIAFLIFELVNYSVKGLRHYHEKYLMNILLFLFILLFSVFENAPSFIYFQF